MREYENALFSLMDIVIQHSPDGVAQAASLLRDQYVEFVSDGNLSALSFNLGVHSSVGGVSSQAISLGTVRMNGQPPNLDGMGQGSRSRRRKTNTL